MIDISRKEAESKAAKGESNLTCGLRLYCQYGHCKNQCTLIARAAQKAEICTTQKDTPVRLPLIKHINEFAKKYDEDFLHETIMFLEDLADCSNIKDEELDVIGELLSNTYGALEVRKDIAEGKSERDALNAFMKRVTGSIGK